MSRMTGITLLLIVLVSSLCDSTASAESVAQSGVTKLDILRCRCTQSSRGKLRCPPPLHPTDSKEKQALKKCLCSAGKQNKRPELLRFCHISVFGGSATPL